MKHLLRLSFLLLSLVLALPLSAQTPSVDWTVRTEHISGDSHRILMTADITKGWHMYDLQEYEMGPEPTRFTFKVSDGVKLDGRVTSIEKPVRIYDDVFEMEIGYYENRVTFVQNVKLTAPKATIEILAEWMICDESSCMPPDDETFTVELSQPAGLAVAEPAKDETIAPVTEEELAEETAEASEELAETFPVQDQFVEAVEAEILPASVPHTSLWALIIEAILWGFAALLTPCVFPMVPMTVSFFMKGSKSPAHGRFRASMYGLFIVLLYTLPIAAIILTTRIVGGETVTADIFNWIATHWLPNIIFFLVFLIFAASFFGAFEITLPSKLVNKSDKNSDRGGLIGIFFMALTLVLVSFSCTGPIVSLVIIKSTAGEFWEPIVTMLAFSIAFALPFALMASFPSLLNKMPKSGGWLNSVKVVLGFIEVALGLKFLSVADQAYNWGLLDREIYLAIWIVVFSLMGLYLLGKIKFKHDSDLKHIGITRLGLVILTFSFVVYMIPGMWGAPLKGLSGYLPPLHTQDFVIQSGAGIPVTGQQIHQSTMPKAKYSDVLHLPHGLEGFFDLTEAEDYARKVNKPVFVDLTGHACVNCREMEQRVWSDPQVLKLLREEFVVVALYLDNKSITLPESEWIVTEKGKTLKSLGSVNAYLALKYYGQNAQPYYIIQNADRDVLVPPRAYDLNIQAFVDFLQSGLDEFRKGQ